MLMVIKNNNAKGNYMTIFNSKTGFHTHSSCRKDTLQILECGKRIEKGSPVGKIPNNIRVRAMKLFVGGKKL